MYENVNILCLLSESFGTFHAFSIQPQAQLTARFHSRYFSSHSACARSGENTRSLTRRARTSSMLCQKPTARPASAAAPASLNHYSKGAVCDWLFRVMCGIRVDGENHFTIAPRPGGHFTHVEAEYLSIYGRVASRWEKTGDSITYTVTIPALQKARI